MGEGEPAKDIGCDAGSDGGRIAESILKHKLLGELETRFKGQIQGISQEEGDLMDKMIIPGLKALGFSVFQCYLTFLFITDNKILLAVEFILTFAIAFWVFLSFEKEEKK
jgi:hypothetical protein